MRLKKSILALTLTTVLSVTSCATPKEAVEESRMEAQSSTSLKVQEVTRLDTATAAIVERIVEEYFRRQRKNTTTTDEVTERITEIFDTSQPPDSATGTPPLLSRITEKSAAKSRSESREQTEATTAGSTAEAQTKAATLTYEADTATASESHEATEAKSREQRSNPCWLTGLEIVGFLVAGGFILWLLCTVGKAIKQFSNNH